jgi:hypothetical protein
MKEQKKRVKRPWGPNRPKPAFGPGPTQLHPEGVHRHPLALLTSGAHSSGPLQPLAAVPRRHSCSPSRRSTALNLAPPPHHPRAYKSPQASSLAPLFSLARGASRTEGFLAEDCRTRRRPLLIPTRCDEPILLLWLFPSPLFLAHHLKPLLGSIPQQNGDKVSSRRFTGAATTPATLLLLTWTQMSTPTTHSSYPHRADPHPCLCRL